MRTLDEIIAELFNMLEGLYLDGCLSDEERRLLDKLSDEQKKNVFMAIMAINSNDAKSAGIGYLTTTLGDTVVGRILEAFND